MPRFTVQHVVKLEQANSATQDVLHQHWFPSRTAARFSGVLKTPELQLQLTLPHALVSSRKVNDCSSSSRVLAPPRLHTGIDLRRSLSFRLARSSATEPLLHIRSGSRCLTMARAARFPCMQRQGPQALRIH